MSDNQANPLAGLTTEKLHGIVYDTLIASGFGGSTTVEALGVLRERLEKCEAALRAVDALIVCTGVRMDAPPEYRLISSGRQEALALVRAALEDR